MFLVDSHCHLDAMNYELPGVSLDSILSYAQQRGVMHCLSVATTLEGYVNLKTWMGERQNVSLSCGVHPLHVNEAVDFIQLRQFATEPKVVALGETGLDYFYQKDNLLNQQQAFREHIRIARAYDKPVIVHSREAKNDTLTILREENADLCGGVLHCFTEDRATAKALLELDFYLSFSGIITFKNANNLHDIIRYLPLNRLLLETDSPYLAPIPYRGKENQPAYVREIAEYIASLKKIKLSELAHITTNNFCRLFNLKIQAN